MKVAKASRYNRQLLLQSKYLRGEGPPGDGSRKHSKGSGARQKPRESGSHLGDKPLVWLLTAKQGYSNCRVLKAAAQQKRGFRWGLRGGKTWVCNGPHKAFVFARPVDAGLGRGRGAE